MNKAPNFKITVNSVRWNCNETQVHCFLTINLAKDSEFMHLLRIMGSYLGFDKNEARDPQYRWVGDFQPEKISQSKNYIYNPCNYEFHGAAVLKDGDESDINFARKVAYKKAYRQALRFVFNKYMDMYNYVSSYVTDVWYEQLAQFSDRIKDVNNEFVALMGGPIYDSEGEK